MRPVAFTIIAFIYIFSVSLWLVDEMVLKQIGMMPIGLQGDYIDTEELLEENKQFAELDQFLDVDSVVSGYETMLLVLELLGGVYAFNVLTIIGVPDAFIIALKLIFPMLVAFQIIWFIRGRV